MNQSFIYILVGIIILIGIIGIIIYKRKEKPKETTKIISNMKNNIINKYENSNVTKQLWKDIQKFRNVMPSYHPNNPTPQAKSNILSAVNSINTILLENKSEIYSMCSKQGWPTSGAWSTDIMYNGAISNIKYVDRNPNANWMGSLNSLNENTTQLHFMMTNPKK